MGNFQLNQFYVKFATKCIFPPETCYIFENVFKKMDELRMPIERRYFLAPLNKKASLAGLFSMFLFNKYFQICRFVHACADDKKRKPIIILQIPVKLMQKKKGIQ
ncbi:MAG: hypothetical protein FNP40_03170 [Dehalobacter sp. 4CP]|nr:hypothetical protein [Dehalobacter sp. 4CP]